MRSFGNLLPAFSKKALMADAALSGLSTGATNFVGALTTMKTALPWIAGIGAAIAAISIGVKAYKEAHPSLESLQKDAEAAKNEFNEMEQKVKDTSEKIEELNKLKEQNLLTSAESEELDYLERQNEIYTAQRDLLKEIADYKERQAKDKANEDAVAALGAYRELSTEGIPSINSVFFGGSYIGATAEDMKGSNSYDILMAAIKKYGEVQGEIDSLTESISGAEKDQYQQIHDDIEAKRKELAHWDSILENSKKDLTSILGSLSGEDDIAYVMSLLSMIEDTRGIKETTDGLKAFQKGLNEIGDDADAVIKKFLKGEKLTNDESKRLIKTIDEMGLSADDAASYFARLSDGMDLESPSIDTSSAISNLASLRDELKETTEDLEAYNKAMEGGEKGDSADKYKSAWEKAVEDFKAGKNDSTAMHAAARLFFSDEQLAAMNWNLNEVGKLFKSDMFKSIFGKDGSNIGENFGNYLHDNAEQFKGLVDIVDKSDGSFSIAIQNFDQLADKMGVSKGFLYSLIDGLDIFGTQVMMDGDDIDKFAKQFNEFAGKSGKTGKDARREGVRGLIDSMIGDGTDPFTVKATMKQLKKALPDLFDGFGNKTFNEMIQDALGKTDTGESDNKDEGDSVEDLKAKYQKMLEDLQQTVDGKPVVIHFKAGEGEGEFDPSVLSNLKDGEEAVITCTDQGTAEKVRNMIVEKFGTAVPCPVTVTYVDGNGDPIPSSGEPEEFNSENAGGVSGTSESTGQLIKQYQELAGAATEASEAEEAAMTSGGSGASQFSGTSEYVKTLKEANEARKDLEEFNRANPEIEPLANEYSALQNDFIEAAKAYQEAVDARDEWLSQNGSEDDAGQLDIDVENALAKLQEATTTLNTFAEQNPEVSLDAIDNTDPAIQSALSALAQLPDSKTINIVANYVENGSIGGGSGSGGGSGGNKMVRFASGTRNAPGGLTLVNEEGPELISDNGRAFIAGGGKPAIVDLSKGAIVLNADETKTALKGKTGLKKSIGAAANGYKTTPHTQKVSLPNLFKRTIDVLGNKYDVTIPIPGYSLTATPKTETPDQSKLKTKKPYDNGGGGNGGGGGQPAKELTEIMDWIEVAIDRIERKIKELSRTAESTFKRLTTRLSSSKDEISAITKEIDIQQKGYERYLKEANSVGLSSNLAQLVRDGTIDITKYDKDTKKLIDNYKQWYDKAIDCADAVKELHENLAELYEARFQMVQQDYENQLAQMEHQANMIQKNLDMIEAKSYLDSAEYYRQLSEIQKSDITKLGSELSELNTYFKEAMDSGEIQEGSEAWYSMKDSINEVEEAIADANIQLVEYEKTMRTIAWDTFDYAQERFGQLSQEANFLIDLMKNDDLFDENGLINSKGTATVGMRVVNYNAYMAQADAYAKEMQRIQKELAKDPYDTELIKRREELIKLQQESIMSAESEKDAMSDLVEQGINKELEALKKLIDEYNESIDSAKDLYEYQKKVTEQAGDVATIEKQLAAYAGDTSEESRARIQKLNEDLRKARETLQDTERDQSISDQKKLLDDLYSEYEELLNKKLDDVDALMREMIERTNASLDDVREEIRISAEEVGYSVTDGMWSVLSNAGFSNYDKMFEGFSAANEYLAHITNTVDAMARASGAIKAYASGGLVDYTGYAMVHGSSSKPELMLNARDTANFLALRDVLSSTPYLSALSNYGGRMPSIGSAMGYGQSQRIDKIEVNIPIDHVESYNDLVEQMRSDPKFQKLIEAMTLDTAVGKSKFQKNKIKF